MLLESLASMKERFEEMGLQLADPAIISNQATWQKIAKDRSALEDVVEAYDKYLVAVNNMEEAKEMMNDPEMAELAQEEYKISKAESENIEQEINVLLLPKDPNDSKDIVLEIRAGTGGEEAALFAADLYRMYMRYAERHNYKVEVLNLNETEIGGVKEVQVELKGKGVHSRLKYESGAHRVQRVPETESQGRIQTSAATVVVMPVADDVDIEIKTSDLRIDTFRATGAGGQHVNTTDSAIRITHIPTGIVTTSMEERSQHSNKDKAMKMLKTRIYNFFQEKHEAEQAATRRSKVGTGDRSGRIRTYNFAQSRVSDHRINLTLYKLDAFLDGDLDEMLDALAVADRTAQLEEISGI